MKKSISILLVISMLSIMLIGCGASDESSSSDKSLVYISRAMSDPFASWLANSVQSQAEEAGYKVTIMDQENDAAKAVECLENAKNLNPDIIILQPEASSQVLGTIENIKADDIPVLIANVILPEDPEACPTVVCDDYTLGRTIGAEAAANLPENANVVILNGIAGMAVTSDRRQGFEDGLLSERNDVTLLEEQTANFNKDEAMNIMDDWLQKYDNIDGVLAANDGMALGAIESYKSNNLDFSNVQFYGIDGLADGCLSIKAGELTATVLQDATTMATELVTLANGVLDGSVTDCPFITIDAQFINADNVADMIASHQANGLIEE